MSDLQVRGPIIGATGSPVPFTAGYDGGQRTVDAHARYMEAVYRGNVWLAANQAGAALSNLSATCTGFCLSNPAGSGKLLVPLVVGIAQTSAAGAAVNTVQLAANINPVAAAVVHTTPLTVRNALLGSSGTGVGLADGACTLPAAPVAIMNLWSPSVSATATTAVAPMVWVPLDGLIIVGQGCAISLSALAALSAACHMLWEEIPI